MTRTDNQTWLPTYVRDAALAQLQIEFLEWSVGRQYSPWLWYEFLDEAYERFRQENRTR